MLMLMLMPQIWQLIKELKILERIERLVVLGGYKRLPKAREFWESKRSMMEGRENKNKVE